MAFKEELWEKGYMWQEFKRLDEYELTDYTVDKLIKFIEEKYKENDRCKFMINLQMKGSDRIWPYKVSCYTDYYRGQIVGISPTGAKRGECPVKDSNYKEFVAEMVKRGQKAHIYSLS